MRIVAPDKEGMAAAAEALLRGEVVAYPTETVYGLGVDPFSERALEQLFSVKGRDRAKPVLLIVAGIEDLAKVAAGFSDRAAAYAEAFWPGPLSLLLPASPGLASGVTAGGDTVCVRCPACAVARDLCAAVGGAVTSTSANRSGEDPARRLDEADLPGVAIGLDGGPLAPSAPSTVLDPETGEILRHGAVSEAAIRACLSS